MLVISLNPAFLKEEFTGRNNVNGPSLRLSRKPVLFRASLNSDRLVSVVVISEIVSAGTFINAVSL
jgi:hypothetical protein